MNRNLWHAKREDVMALCTNEILDYTDEEVAAEAGVPVAMVRRVRARIRERLQTVPWALARRVATQIGWKRPVEELIATALLRMARAHARKEG